MSKSKTSNELVILVVEDESLIRDVVVDHLREAGCIVFGAHSGEQSIELLRQSQIDVLFTDIELSGGLTGWDVGEACRKAQSEVGIIYTSGHPIQRHRIVSGGLFLNKPYRLEQVLMACRNLCAADHHHRSSP